MSLGPLDFSIRDCLRELGVPLTSHPSPNHNARPEGGIIDALIIHYTALEAAPSLSHLTSEEMGVSTHYLIDRDGQLSQLVSVSRRAWHAGQGELAGVSDVNGRSVGIDLVFVPGIDAAYTDAQYQVLAYLTGALLEHLPINPALIVGHEHVARPVGRKEDPGPLFDWRRYFVLASVPFSEEGALPLRG